MNVGDIVRIDKCDVCPAVVGKKVKVKGVDASSVVLNYGRGRPPVNRPSELNREDVSLIKE